MKITILYGTETGNAEMLAEDISAKLGSSHEVLMLNLSDCSSDVLQPGQLYLIVSSTYGEGEVPGSAKAFYSALQAEAPSLEGVTYGVFGLGDRGQYPTTFAEGSKRLDELLSQLGAKRIGERGIHDASSSALAEDVAEAWLFNILPETRTEA